MDKGWLDKNGNIILFGVFIMAVALRLIGLGSSSLTMNEAENAMATLRLFRDGETSQLLYTLPTAVLFSMFGASEFTARLLPAVMGSLLVLLPLCLKEKIGVYKALLLAFLFAFDPVLLFWSKRADAVIPAITLFAAAAVLLMKDRHGAGTACFLVALCGGERSWPVLIVFAFCTALSGLIRKENCVSALIYKIHRKDILIGIGVFCLLCCGFGLFPGGFSGFGRGFVQSFQAGPKWQYPGLTAELAALCLYSGVPLLICIVSSIRKRKFAGLLLSLAGLAVLLLWQGIVMLPWTAVLLWCCAADSLLSVLEKIKGKVDFPFCVAASIIPAAYAFFYFRLVELFKQTNGNELIQLTINGTIQTIPLTRFWGTVLLMAAALVIIGLVVKILMGFVESGSVRRDLFTGCLVILSWVGVRGIWNAGGFDRIGDHPAAPHLENTVNILNGAYTSYTDTALFTYLNEVIAKHGDVSNTQYGLNFIPDDAMLDWYLREHPGIRTSANSNTELSGIELILTKDETSYGTSGFVCSGQNWRGTMDWNRMTFQDWGKWLIFGDGRLTEETPVKLWVKSEYVYSLENDRSD
ncbi:MAG: hypothetical protein IJI57_06420 [Flexilinea sp.]|nr:hypothetical protein [Flexilinea sp.]